MRHTVIRVVKSMATFVDMNDTYSGQSGEVNDHYCCHHDACSDQRGETDDHFCRHEP